jgi:hypothetical protein
MFTSKDNFIGQSNSIVALLNASSAINLATLLAIAVTAKSVVSAQGHMMH